MPDKTLTLTDAEVATLAEIAAEANTTVDALLLSEARTQIAQADERKLAAWWRDLALADRKRIYAAETA